MVVLLRAETKLHPFESAVGVGEHYKIKRYWLSVLSHADCFTFLVISCEKGWNFMNSTYWKSVFFLFTVEVHWYQYVACFELIRSCIKQLRSLDVEISASQGLLHRKNYSDVDDSHGSGTGSALPSLFRAYTLSPFRWPVSRLSLSLFSRVGWVILCWNIEDRR